MACCPELLWRSCSGAIGRGRRRLGQYRRRRHLNVLGQGSTRRCRRSGVWRQGRSISIARGAELLCSGVKGRDGRKSGADGEGGESDIADRGEAAHRNDPTCCVERGTRDSMTLSRSRRQVGILHVRQAGCGKTMRGLSQP